MLSPNYPTTDQSEEHPWAPPSLNHKYKTSHLLCPNWTHSFENINLLWSLLPGKAIQLFFSTSSKTLSLRYISNLVSGYRGWIRLQLGQYQWGFCPSPSVSLLHLPFPDPSPLPHRPSPPWDSVSFQELWFPVCSSSRGQGVSSSGKAGP